MFNISSNNDIFGINNITAQMNKYLNQIQASNRNSSKDDSADQFISDSLRSQYLALLQGTSNAHNATSLLNIAIV